MNSYDYKAIALVGIGTFIIMCLLISGAVFILFPYLHKEEYWTQNPVDSGTYMLIFGTPAICALLHSLIYAVHISNKIKKPGYRSVH